MADQPYPRVFSRAALVIAACAAVLMGAAERGTACRRVYAQESVGRVLRRAEAALGGQELLQRVESLAVVANLVYPPPNAGVRPWRFTLAVPNRFHWQVGPTAHTLAGTAFWQNQENPPPIVERARANVTRTFFRMSVVFLLGKGPEPPLRVTYEGRQEIDGISGDVLRFVGPDGFAARLLLSPETSRPVLFDEDAASLGLPGIGGDGGQRWRLEDQRPEAGLWVPHRVHQQVGQFDHHLEVKSVTVNPEIDPRLFARP